ncbi:MAG: STAS domain-containing protein [Acidimicrobiales bacterium]
MDFGLEVAERDGSFVIVARGDIDVASAPRLREAVIDALGRGHRHMVIDLDAVDFLDSTGLGVLVGALKRVRTLGGDLHLVCNQTRILKVFDITGLDRVFLVHPSVTVAVAAR